MYTPDITLTRAPRASGESPQIGLNKPTVAVFYPVCTVIFQDRTAFIESVADERIQPPYSLSILRPDFTKANPKAGAIQLSFNVNGSLLLARFEDAPTLVFLYSFPSSQGGSSSPSHASVPFQPKLSSVLVHSKAVTSARWNPVRKGSLAISTGSGSMYLWSDEWVGEGGELEEVAECVGVPASTCFCCDGGAADSDLGGRGLCYA